MQLKAHFQRVFESRGQAWECAECIKTFDFCGILAGRFFFERIGLLSKSGLEKSTEIINSRLFLCEMLMKKRGLRCFGSLWALLEVFL